jgi:16S rRNA (cytosine1402-N4)-methyltransferase
MNVPGSGEISPHLPVLYNEIIHAIHPVSAGRYIDATVGAGGHAWGILNASMPEGLLLGLDIDPQALALAVQKLEVYHGRFTLIKASYTALDQQAALLGWNLVQGIILDLGASSMQFDTPERGFSFQVDGPLDMRFDPGSGLKASKLINQLPEDELANLIWRFGEEHRARRIAKMIVASRPLETTRQLAEVVALAVGKRRGKLHPATLTFQALRIAVNHELDALQEVLPIALKTLAPGGRLAIISFHSLEDRLVKQFFAQESKDCICPPGQPVCTCGHKAIISLITRHPLMPTQIEINHNPRARSARLRVVEKL